MDSILKKIIFITILLLIIIIFSSLFNLRLCLIWNIFNIPCVGCGLTRGIFSILNLDFVSALKYNYLSIILFFGYIISLSWALYDFIKRTKTLQNFIKKYNVYLTIFFLVLGVIGWYINLNNPLLYT